MYALPSPESSVGLLEKGHIYAATIRVPYLMTVRSSATYTLSVLFSAYALWLMLRLIQPSGVYAGKRTDDPHFTVRSIGRKHADENA